MTCFKTHYLLFYIIIHFIFSIFINIDLKVFKIYFHIKKDMILSYPPHHLPLKIIY